MITNGKATHTEGTLLNTSVVAIVGAFAANATYAGYAEYCIAMGLFGVFGLARYFSKICMFDRIFKGLKLGVDNSYPVKKGKERTNEGMMYKFTLPAGLTSEDFIKEKLAIEQYLGKQVDIIYTYKEIRITILEENRKTFFEYVSENIKGNVPILIGYNKKGELVSCDLSNGEPHLLIAGESGSGKSTSIRSIITNLILNSNVTLHLIDLKRGAEFQIFQKCKSVKSFARTKSEAEKLLNEISSEVDRRYDLFFKDDCIDIKEYNSKHKKQLGYEVIVIDEFADLMDEKPTIRLMESISSKCRAAGLHLIIATQRPDMKVLNGRIKANVPTVLGLKAKNDVNSKIIIDTKGLEDLRGKGHGLFLRGTLQEVQSPFLSAEHARELLKPTYVTKLELVPDIKNGEIENFDFLDVI